MSVVEDSRLKIILHARRRGVAVRSWSVRVCCGRSGAGGKGWLRGGYRQDKLPKFRPFLRFHRKDYIDRLLVILTAGTATLLSLCGTTLRNSGRQTDAVHARAGAQQVQGVPRGVPARGDDGRCR